MVRRLRRIPAGALTLPRSPTAAMRLSVTRTSPFSITSSPRMVMTRAPVSRMEPVGLARGSSTTASTLDAGKAMLWRMRARRRSSPLVSSSARRKNS